MHAAYSGIRHSGRGRKPSRGLISSNGPVRIICVMPNLLRCEMTKIRGGLLRKLRQSAGVMRAPRFRLALSMLAQKSTVYFRLLFVYDSFMFHGPTSRICDFVIACKRCRENIAAPVETMPGGWIIHTCPLCGERRRYLPAEIFRGRLSYKVEKLGVRHGA